MNLVTDKGNRHSNDIADDGKRTSLHFGSGHRGGFLALSPAIVFLMMYVGVSLAIGDFYALPITVALVVASVWGVGVLRGRGLYDRIKVFSSAAGHHHILYMVWVFILAGAFASLVKGTGAVDAMVRLTMSCFPPGFILPAVFLSACLISMSIGTSVGTVVALTPLVVELAETAGAPVALYVAAVLGGSFFGDNLSFISDTTIAATRSQGCEMNEKFKANLRIALPAAIVTLAFYTVVGLDGDSIPVSVSVSLTDLRLVAPYLLVIVLAASGVNVNVVLVAGIALGLLCAVPFGLPPMEAASLMGKGIDGMSELIVITLLAAGMLGIIREAGGIDYLIRCFDSRGLGFRGAQVAISSLTAVVNLCTANNTVAIITTGSMTRSLAEKHGIAPRRAASLLDTSSCIMQCLIPFGAQTLLATGIAGISPAAPWPYLYYPWALAACLIVSIFLIRRPRTVAAAAG